MQPFWWKDTTFETPIGLIWQTTRPRSWHSRKWEYSPEREKINVDINIKIKGDIVCYFLTKSVSSIVSWRTPPEVAGQDQTYFFHLRGRRQMESQVGATTICFHRPPLQLPPSIVPPIKLQLTALHSEEDVGQRHLGPVVGVVGLGAAALPDGHGRGGLGRDSIDFKNYLQKSP